ncbi:hypothetical protein GXW74_01405 [Roseomonas eburnea]|uniref:D-isomer specific 2-hydroxyacid dehydrogenase NAD-binding domain-containing protein n=1 Tax=Neoroseomonas eburnea TaxID=1346889 RepID=A0A9X9X5Z1_9PROT|nr:NAD(P)-dependent oxidoreductase [Neoroseomonas eburnea]MBR0679127.1 hypothetical protein [Neoroseomonas eburnea]
MAEALRRPQATAAAPSLRVTARHGAGVDGIDLTAAEARGLAVTRAAGANARAIAEHAFALMMPLLKDLPAVGAAMAGGAWEKTTRIARDAEGTTLGILGYGAIGARLSGWWSSLPSRRTLNQRAFHLDLRCFARVPPSAAWFPEIGSATKGVVAVASARLHPFRRRRRVARARLRRARRSRVTRHPRPIRFRSSSTVRRQWRTKRRWM